MPEPKIDGFNKWKNEALQSRIKIQELSEKVEELWQKSANLDIQVSDRQRESEALKAKLEALNDVARQNIVKKNLESERLQKLEIENEDLRFKIGYKDAKIEELNGFKFEFSELEKRCQELKNENEELIEKIRVLNEIKENESLEITRLKNENENLNGQISGLQKKVNEFSEFKLVQDRAAKEKESILNSLNIELAKLKSENQIYREAQSKESRKMYAFMVVVSILAIFANFTHVGAKYLSLIDSPTILNKITCYVSMLVFDLAVFLFTIKGKENAAISFAIGVFLIVFMQLGSPFVGAGLSAEYAEKILSGLIYSGMFAFIPYKLSQLFTEK